MGDIADLHHEEFASDMLHQRAQASRAASQLSDKDLVQQVGRYLDGVGLIDRYQTMSRSICAFYRQRGHITDRQRNALVITFIDLSADDYADDERYRD